MALERTKDTNKSQQENYQMKSLTRTSTPAQTTDRPDGNEFPLFNTFSMYGHR